MAEQLVHLILAGGVSPHQPLDRAGLVRCVVVDVESGILFPAGVDPVNEPLESAPFLLSIMGPPVLEYRLSSIHGDGAPEVLQSAFYIRKALHVEEHVVRGGRWEERQPTAGL